MGDSKSYHARCFCGAVELTVTGEPVAMGFCHCSDCRHWAAAPINAFTLWQPDAVQITRGQEHVATFNRTEHSLRKFCKRCGGHLMADHPGMKLVDVYAALLHDLAFQPAVHVHYGEKVVAVRDGLPKMKDLPAEMGGSGTVVPE